MAASSSDIWYRFFVSCHARPAGWEPREPSPSPAPTGPITSGDLTRPLGVTFEGACEALSALPRMFCEPDGSFVWRAADGREWQVDGVLYDAAPGLMYVELKGNCPAEQFDRLLAALGHDAVPLVFQLIQEGRIVDESAFRQWAREQAESREGPVRE